MITEQDVLRAYQNALHFKRRQMEIERNERYETEVEHDERLDAICEFDTLELQYLAQFT